MLNKINENLLPKVSVVKNILLTKIQVLEKLSKIDYCFYQIVSFLARKNQLSFEISISNDEFKMNKIINFY